MNDRVSNFEEIYYLVQGTELAKKFPPRSPKGGDLHVEGITWDDLLTLKGIPSFMHLQVALDTMLTVVDLALEHKIALGDRNRTNVIVSPLTENGNTYRGTSGDMRIVQVDFEDVRIVENKEILRITLLKALEELGLLSSARRQVDLDGIRMSILRDTDLDMRRHLQKLHDEYRGESFEYSIHQDLMDKIIYWRKHFE